MNKRDQNQSYSEKEVLQRMEAALRGARIAGHKTMNDIPKKNGESRAIQRRPKAKRSKQKS